MCDMDGQIAWIDPVCGCERSPDVPDTVPCPDHKGTCKCPDTLSRAEARRIAGYLHTINALAVDVWRDGAPPETLKAVGDLVRVAMRPLLELRGQTDFYGNPTHSCAVRAQEQRLLDVEANLE